MRGLTAQVWRGAPDEFGDGGGGVHVGDIDGCVVDDGSGWRAETGVPGEYATHEPRIFAPRRASIKITAGDRVVVDGVTYRAVGNREWDHEHALTGRQFARYGIRLQGAA